jgi:hypothetical protein
VCFVIKRLDVGLCAFFESILGCEGSEALGSVDEKLILVLGGHVFELFEILRERGDGDRGCLVALSPGEPLPELLCQEWHEGVDHGQTTLYGSVQGLLSALLLFFAAFVKDGFAVLNICVAQELLLVSLNTTSTWPFAYLIKVLVGDLRGKRELASLEVLINPLCRGGEFVENPSLRQSLLS